MLKIQIISPLMPAVKMVIAPAIGHSLNSKIAQVIKLYQQKNTELIGAFYIDRLVGVVGSAVAEKITIKHISVIENYRLHGIGTKLIQHVQEKYLGKMIEAETDVESVEFYKKLGFSCWAFQGRHNLRYKCQLKSMNI